MTNHTPEKVADLIAEAREVVELDHAPVTMLVRELADALEAVSAERDEALAVIADVRSLHFEHENTIHTTPATVCAHRYCVDSMGDQVAWPCPTGAALSRIPEHPKED